MSFWKNFSDMIKLYLINVVNAYHGKVIINMCFRICRGGKLKTVCEKIRLPDDCTVGFIICEYFDVKTNVPYLCTDYAVLWLLFYLRKAVLHCVLYIVDYYLKKELTVIPGFHSHLEGLWRIRHRNLESHVSQSNTNILFSKAIWCLISLLLPKSNKYLLYWLYLEMIVLIRKYGIYFIVNLLKHILSGCAFYKVQNVLF